jgi:transcriptional regulator with XRE-family HTH domain
MRTVRLDRELLQKDVALLLGVSTESVVNWEHGKADPHIEVLPRIMDFLGYCPYEPAPSLGARLKAIRQKFLGISQEAMARAVGIDPTTLSRIERADIRISRAIVRKIERYRETLRKV